MIRRFSIVYSLSAKTAVCIGYDIFGKGHRQCRYNDVNVLFWIPKDIGELHSADCVLPTAATSSTIWLTVNALALDQTSHMEIQNVRSLENVKYTPIGD